MTLVYLEGHNKPHEVMVFSAKSYGSVTFVKRA